MKNSEKYRTAEERARAFKEWCHGLCGNCPLERHDLNGCGMLWLDLEAEEEPLPCPFCGGETWVRDYVPANERVYDILCHGCEYRSQKFYSRNHVVAAHNRVARAVMEAGKKEDK